MNFQTLIRLARIDGLDQINVYAMEGGIRISIEAHREDAATYRDVELPVRFADFLREALESRQHIVSQGWSLAFDAKSLRLRQMSASEIVDLLVPNIRPRRVA